ncbi:MAG: outer membrane beta-barrel protein [Draconibacterium sp.]|nr:outer membrane beta-barrel protein [Draconibacterium sp.]
MKNTLKFVLFLLIVLAALNSYSQTFGLKGGLNRNDVLYENASGNLSDIADMTMQGFHVGATMENLFSEVVSLESGLFVSLKSFKLDEYLDGVAVRNKTYLYYLDIPIALKTKFDLGATSKWFVAAGPVIDIGFAGNQISTYNWHGDGQAVKEKIEWGNNEGEINRFDVGLTFGAGVEFNLWQVGVYYDFGLTDISSDTNPENTIKNRLWKLSVGYKLGSK